MLKVEDSAALGTPPTQSTHVGRQPRLQPRALIAATLIAALALPGCEFAQRYANKPWGKATFIPAAVCSVVGAGGGVGVQEWRRGTSLSVVTDSSGNVVESSRKKDDPEYWKGALVGAAIGAAVCGLAGHYFEPDQAAAAPPVPEPAPVPPPSQRTIVLRGVNFDFDQSAVRPDSRPILDEAAEILKQNPNVHISVEGHTDEIGSVEYNQALSERRAEATFRYLVNHGVEPQRMQAIGYGKSRPVADNSTESGRAQNRRVELHVISDAAPTTPPPPDTGTNSDTAPPDSGGAKTE